MKNLKKLTRTMKEVLSKNGLVPEQWGLVRGTNDVFIVQHRKTGEQKYFEL